HVADAGRATAGRARRDEAVGRTGGGRAGAVLRHVADAGRAAADDARRREGVGRAGGARARAGLGAGAHARGGAAGGRSRDEGAGARAARRAGAVGGARVAGLARVRAAVAALRLVGDDGARPVLVGERFVSGLGAGRGDDLELGVHADVEV